MSRRGFWFGLLVGVVITGLLLAAVVFVMRFRWPAAAVYGLRGRQFGVNPRGWYAPRMPGRWFGFGAMLCGPLLLLAAALGVGALLGRHWQQRGQDREAQPVAQAPSVEKSVNAEPQPPAEAGPSEAKAEPPAEAGPSEAKG